ncbi:MAG: RES family NAD+ phosphorylase [Nitrospiraceae bacterium]|jgi:RES domain-containing protein|nr:RES family NAD+ phosphorylase [Nitrospiraceae bacterium]
MISCYRLVIKDYAAFALTGNSAAEHPGRWNHRGYRAVYAAESRALASLELYVNLGDEDVINLEFSLFALHIPQEVRITDLKLKDLPNDWRSIPPSDSTRDIGTKWLAKGETAALTVPSIIIPEEKNFILNPGHPDFQKIKKIGPLAFSYDPRIIKLS